MIEIKTIRYFELRLPFTASFKHGSAERNETETMIVAITDAEGRIGYGEGCPRSYVTGESIASCDQFYQSHQHAFQKITSLDDLKHYVDEHDAEINNHPAAWCAIELAILDLLAQSMGVPVETLLGLNNQRDQYMYSAVLGDSSPNTFAALYKRYRELGLTDFKIKLSKDVSREKEKLQCLTNDLSEISIRADANNLWLTTTEAIAYLKALDVPFESLEEPIKSNQHQDLMRLADALDRKIVLDESFMRFDQIELLHTKPSIWIANIRVSKMGGILRSLKIIDELLKQGIAITIGAQVGETSLLTRAALLLADVAGHNLSAQEGAFGELLLAHDLFDPVLQFGSGGILKDKTGFRSKPGFGLSLHTSLDTNPYCIAK